MQHNYIDMRNTKYRSFVVLAFLLCVIGALVLLSCVYPKEGISLNGRELRFPYWLEFVFSQDTTAVEEQKVSPEELLEERIAQMRIDEEAAFLDFFASNPARLSFPYCIVTDTLGNIVPFDSVPHDSLLRDYSYFDDFYSALDKADEQLVGISHYGDSQIEEDRITKQLRGRLQTQFGGGGVGLLPFKHTYYNLSVSEVLKGNYTIYSPISYYRDAERSSNNYGPLLQASGIDGTCSLHIFPRKNTESYSGHYFSHAVVLSSAGVSLTAKDAIKKEVSSSTDMSITDFVMPDSTTNLYLDISGKGDIYGVSLHNSTGVVADNIALRGSSGIIFRSVNQEQLKQYFSVMNTRLILLEFGGNSMPAIHSEKAIHNYIARLLHDIEILKRLAPDAKLLFIGPSDMVSLSGGVPHTLPMLEKFDTYAEEMMNRHGVAYWSMFRAMGGANSMVEWVRARPQLAASDYVHFTRTGAAKVGDLLTDAVLTGYNYYKMREKYNQPIDSLMVQLEDVDCDTVDNNE